MHHRLVPGGKRSFTLVLEVYDLAASNRHLIDRAVHKGLLFPEPGIPRSQSGNTSTRSLWHQATLSNRLSIYNFYMRLVCAPYHYNNTCTQVCDPTVTPERYKCDTNGNKICEPGWSGQECGTGRLTTFQTSNFRSHL
ncbi:unnamed protein product [Protopolystoma xenopodis]|uniref:Delta-like protein n=1 Tax=Protopolystoma xenopodis TaxID=117903 RepID=A0A448WBH1_9PLAT|nr:unnamed protein product [Protopolystoma xenopodis]